MLADLDRLGIAAIGIVLQPGVVVGLDIGQRGRVHRLGRDIAMGQKMRGAGKGKNPGCRAQRQSSGELHRIHPFPSVCLLAMV
jgi:hypothetical protein